jgi:hypothetical protein
VIRNQTNGAAAPQRHASTPAPASEPVEVDVLRAIRMVPRDTYVSLRKAGSPEGLEPTGGYPEVQGNAVLQHLGRAIRIFEAEG